MIFDKLGLGAQELRDLTGSYYANNDFNKIRSDIKSATYQVKKVIGNKVYALAESAYLDAAPDREPQMQQLIELVQRPIAILATLNMYRKNDVSHEDDGRKVKMASDDTDKIPWQWQLDRDDAIQMESYYMAVEELIAYLNEQQLPEWMESKQKKNCDELIIRSGAEFEKYFPIQSSERLYFLLTNFIREVQIMHLSPAYGPKWKEELLQASDPESDLHFAACKSVALYTMSIALLRMPLHLIPGGVVRTFIAENGMQESMPANLQDVQKIAGWLENDAATWLDRMKVIHNGADEEPQMLPQNKKSNKYFRV